MSAILFKAFIPEFFFSITILIQILFNTNIIVNYKLNFPILNKEIFGQIFFVLTSLFFIYLNIKIDIISYNFFLISTSNEYSIKVIYIALCILSSVSIWRGFLVQKLNFFEFFTIMMISILSFLLLLNSLDLISVYLVIELQALCFYILSCFTRKSSFSTEAGLKYFISGAFISGFYLFGCSLIYGCLGTLNLNLINLLLTYSLPTNLNFIVLIGILLVTITFLFKVSAVPFHFWSPDVYEGAPLSSTIIFSILPKFILFTFLIKWFSSLAFFFAIIKYLLLITGIFSVFLGTFFAIKQKRIKRIVIFSSIAQIGFLLLGLSTNTMEGFASVYFFLIIYLITSILIWSFISLFYGFQKRVNKYNSETLNPIYLSNLSNFFENNKLWAILLTFIFYSLAGIPPFIGFLSKLFILYGLIQVKFFFSVVILIFISIVSIFYYVRFIKLLFFENTKLSFNSIKYQTIFSENYLEIDTFSISFLLFLLLYLFFYPNLLLLLTELFVFGNVVI